MQHLLEYSIDGQKKNLKSSLVLKGVDDLNTAMSMTVGLPVAIASELLLNDKISLKGVVIPIHKEIYNPVLEKLEEFDLNINKKNILIVDDISDSGHTLKHYKKQGYTTATLDVRNTTVTKPDYYCNWLETTDWIVYPWEKKDSKSIQDYLDN